MYYRLCGCYHGAWSADHFNVLDLGCGCRRGEAANDREKDQASYCDQGNSMYLCGLFLLLIGVAAFKVCCARCYLMLYKTYSCT